MKYSEDFTNRAFRNQKNQNKVEKVKILTKYMKKCTHKYAALNALGHLPVKEKTFSFTFYFPVFCRLKFCVAIVTIFLRSGAGFASLIFQIFKFLLNFFKIYF